GLFKVRLDAVTDFQHILHSTGKSGLDALAFRFLVCSVQRHSHVVTLALELCGELGRAQCDTFRRHLRGRKHLTAHGAAHSPIALATTCSVTRFAFHLAHAATRAFALAYS